MSCWLGGCIEGRGVWRFRRLHLGASIGLALALAAGGCGSESGDHSVDESTAGATTTATLTATEVVEAEDSTVETAEPTGVSATPTGAPTPTATVAPATSSSSTAETEAPRESDRQEGDDRTPVASATPTAEENSDDDGSEESAEREDSTPPPAIPESDPSDEENVGEETLPLSDPESQPQAEDVVVIESFTVRECVMRGMLRNQSDKLFARDVVLTIESPDGSKNASWHWPLVMLPGEQAPFEININWTRKELAENTPPGSAWGDPYERAQQSWRDIRHSITANLSDEPDVSRSFSWNADRTEGYNLYQSSHDFLVYDDRLFESEDWYDYTYRGGRSYSLLHRARFESIYPAHFVISNNLDPILSDFWTYDFTDIYYTPEISPPSLRNKTPGISYPDFYDSANDNIAENVKVYQAIVRQDVVLDVRELIPHTVVEEIDSNGNIMGRIMTPVTRFENYNSSFSTPVYIRVTKPVRIDGPYGSWGYGSRIWIGNAGQGDPFADIQDTSQASSSGMEERGVPRGTCDLSGGLAVQDFAIQSNSGVAGQVFNIPMGYVGTFDAFEPSQELIDNIIVEDETVTVIDGVIRGLVHNLSSDKFARDVSVTVVPRIENGKSASWHWPLTVQPGERAPFEIAGWAGVSDSDSFDFEVSASFSEQIDISRAFRIEGSRNFGNVYRESARELYDREKYQNENPGDYKDYHIFWQHRNYLLWSEFERLYSDVVTSVFGIDASRFSYSEIYASIVSADSHPSLDSKIDAQVIDKLHVYRAIFNSDMEVVDVLELVPFTSVYSPLNPNRRRLLPVEAIPVPNVWTPKTVQMLLVWPRESEDDDETFHSNQIWIGGAS